LASRWFADRAEELARGLEALAAATPADTPPPRVEECDARKLEPFADASHALVVTSPPYAGVYDYEAEHGVRFTWLGLPRDRFHKDQWGARDAAMAGANPGAWIEGRRRWISEIARTLLPGGKAVFVVGDGVVGSRPEDAAEATSVAAREAGLRFVARASEDRPARSSEVAAIFRETRRREHALLYEKR
jgi:DNA modification methylase